MALYTTSEAADTLHVDERQIRQMCSDGRLRGIKVGRDWLVSLGRPHKFDVPKDASKAAPRAVSGREVQRRARNFSA